MTEFNALVVRESEDGKISRKIETKKIDDLPGGDVVVKVLYSSLNYKDALSATGNKGVTKKYPHTPGIDAAGEVYTSNDERFKPKDKVIVTSYDLGMNTSGGFGEYIRVPAEWVVPLPEGLTFVGIDSQNYPMDKRKKVWNNLASQWRLDNMDQVVNEVTLDDISSKIDDMLSGRHKGRTVIKVGHTS